MGHELTGNECYTIKIVCMIVDVFSNECLHGMHKEHCNEVLQINTAFGYCEEWMKRELSNELSC